MDEGTYFTVFTGFSHGVAMPESAADTPVKLSADDEGS